MKAFEKWPEFMRAGSQPTASASGAARADEGELEIDTAPEVVRPRSNPQGRTARPGRKPLRAQSRAVPKENRGRRLLSMFLAGASVGVVGVAAFFGYFWFTGGGGQSEVPVIQAMDDPVKVKPEDPGGLEVPYQDQLVLNQPGSDNGGTVERLLPPPEAPKPLVDTTTAAAAQQPASTAPSGVASIVVPQSEPAATTVANGAASNTVPQTQTETQTQTQTQAQTQPQAPAQPSTNLAAAPATPAGLNGSVTNGSADNTTLGTTNVQAALPTPAPQPVAPAKGSYLLQLGSFNSAEVGEGAWDRFQKKHPDLLAGMLLFLQEAEVNGKTYHRVQAGPFPNRATAIDLCAELKSRNQDCLVIKR